MKICSLASLKTKHVIGSIENISLAVLKICGHLCALVFISTAVDRRPFDVSGGARTTQAPHRVAANDQIKPKFPNTPNPKIPNTIENNIALDN